MTALIIILTILFFSGLSVLYKLAHTRGCDTVAFVGALNLCAAAICAANALIMRSAWRGAPGGVLWLGMAGGMAGALCLTSMVRALKQQGPLAIVTTLVNLSILIPILFATVFLGETVTWTRVGGMVLFAVFAVLLNLSREPVDAGAPTTGRRPWGWLPLAFAAFFLNGFVLITQRGVGVWYAGWENLFLFGVFVAGAAVCGLALLWRRHVPIARDIRLGAFAGMVAYGGNVCLIRALSLADSYQVLPLVFGVWMAVVALISWLVFSERLNRRSAMALGVGVLALVLLNTAA